MAGVWRTLNNNIIIIIIVIVFMLFMLQVTLGLQPRPYGCKLNINKRA